MLKLMVYLLVQVDKTWYNYNIPQLSSILVGCLVVLGLMAL